ncbi:hypothetical protein WJX73_010613 [Symbiochloris irregularis]|uniref:F-box domain-containing protein n=1 Tax=Symbiochloris irregularis TaxID=706552 RepID=A0AAW1Q089_9CHLO
MPFTRDTSRRTRALEASAGAQLGLLAVNSEVQQVFAAQVLPLIPVRSLAAFACTCKSFRDLAYGRKEIWASAATSFLPPQHPSVSGLPRAAVQGVMQRRASALLRLLSGEARVDRRFTFDCVSCLLFSPRGDRLAVISHARPSRYRPSVVTVFSTEDWTQLWQANLASLEKDWTEQTGLQGCETFAFHHGEVL